MKEHKFYTAGHTSALKHAVSALSRQGFSFSQFPNESVTHLLLPVPSFQADGTIIGGGVPNELLDTLSPNTVIIGGNLKHPCVSEFPKWDLLQDPNYLAQNASITAHCAVKLALSHLPVILPSCPVLIIGWGRIGKCLADLLKSMGAAVTVAARNPQDRAMLSALGYNAAEITAAAANIYDFRIIFNTVPTMVYSQEIMTNCRPDCLKIELASAPGIGGMDIVDGRGLPSKYAPESSGILIANTIMSYMKGAMS